jgi:hypothetical protein
MNRYEWTGIVVLLILLFLAFFTLMDALIERSHALNTCYNHGYIAMARNSDMQYICFGVKDGNSFSIPVSELEKK